MENINQPISLQINRRIQMNRLINKKEACPSNDGHAAIEFHLDMALFSERPFLSENSARKEKKNRDTFFVRGKFLHSRSLRV